jgi:ABC-type glycerol-3-phosphate transport system substrate-binding protein
MFKRKIFVPLAGLVILTMLLAACGPAPTPETIEVEVPVEVEVTRIVEGEPEVVVVTATPEPEEPKEGPEVIIWWSHWANEPAKVAVIEKIAADYEAEHPDVDIVMTWWDKNPLREALRSTMMAGEGYPDITSDWCDIQHVEAGWCEPLTDVLPWENFNPGTELDANYADLGYPDNYKFNIGASYSMLFYNKEIFEELGIEVPDDYQFTSEEYLDVIQKCSDAGYAGWADAIGNRPYPGTWSTEMPLWQIAGAEGFDKYRSGQQSWDTPEARQALEYSVALRDAGLWPDVFATLTIDEFHVYFHTQHQACMLFIPSWYAGRAFKPVEEGGQDPNWHFGMMRFPSFEGGAGNDVQRVGFESGYHALSGTGHEETAKDILRFASQPKYGALWTAVTNIPSVIKYDPATDWPSAELLEELGFEAGKWDWYWEEFNKVYAPVDTGMAPSPVCGEFEDAVVTALNEGLPQGLITVDEAVEILDSALCE